LSDVSRYDGLAPCHPSAAGPIPAASKNLCYIGQCSGSALEQGLPIRTTSRIRLRKPGLTEACTTRTLDPCVAVHMQPLERHTASMCRSPVCCLLCLLGYLVFQVGHLLEPYASGPLCQDKSSRAIISGAVSGRRRPWPASYISAAHRAEGSLQTASRIR
jgi:hypothetical protein